MIMMEILIQQFKIGNWIIKNFLIDKSALIRLYIYLKIKYKDKKTAEKFAKDLEKDGYNALVIGFEKKPSS